MGGQQAPEALRPPVWYLVGSRARALPTAMRETSLDRIVTEEEFCETLSDEAEMLFRLANTLQDKADEQWSRRHLYQLAIEADLVESFLDGLQISTESLMYRGKASTPGFADRNYEFLDTYAPYIIENGGWVPSRVTPDQRARVEQVMEDAALALDITDGVVKGDVVWTGDGPVVIELAALGGRQRLAPHPVHALWTT